MDGTRDPPRRPALPPECGLEFRLLIQVTRGNQFECMNTEIYEIPIVSALVVSAHVMLCIEFVMLFVTKLLFIFVSDEN